MTVQLITCPYCDGAAEQVTGADVYSHRNDLGHKIFWRCQPCAAWIGCEIGTDIPLGILANAELRQWKRAAHDAFDPLWRTVSHNKKRQREVKAVAYAALAKKLGIGIDRARISKFDVDLCKRTVALIEKMKEAMAQ